MLRAFCLIFLVLSPLELFARVGIFALLPNPAGDDTLSEYMEVRNIGCTDIDLIGYRITDASGKNYIFPSTEILTQHTILRLEYARTKIALNNSGNESVTLTDASGGILDMVEYSGTQRDDVVISYPLIDDICSPPDTGSGGSDTGSGGVSVNTGSSVGTGSIGSGSTASGGTDTGSGGSSIGSGSSSGSGGVVSTGSTSTGSDNTGTGGSAGATGSTATGSTGPPPFLLLALQYDDTDSNRKIDTLIIEYSLDLTGSFDTGSIALFSRSGGLSSMKIDTATGYIREASFSGRFLILKIIEQDLEKEALHITNTTSSDLRLKTLGNMQFTSVFAQVPPDFLLTASFSNYQNVSRYETPSPGTGTTSPGVGGTGSLSGVFLFPVILPILQSPTNAVLRETTFLCDSSNLPCRINLTLEPLFTGGLLMRDYICEIGTGSVILIDCNPNTLYFTSSGVIITRLREKLHPENMREVVFSLFFSPSSSQSASAVVSNILSDINPPRIILDFDGAHKGYYEILSDTELNCYTETCSVNFTADRSYDREGGPVRFIWMYDFAGLTTSRDPGVKKFTRGDHDIWLRVIDQSGNASEVHYTIHVLGIKVKEEKTIKKTKEKKPKEIFSGAITELKPSKIDIRMEFFSPPEIALQGKTLTGNLGSYICIAAHTNCQINLTLTGNTRSYIYEWILSDGTVMKGKNPKGWTLPIGKHSVELRVYQKGEVIPYYTQFYPLEVIQKKVLKKPKKIKMKKAKTKKSPKKVAASPLIPEANAMGNQSSESQGMSATPFLLGIILYVFLRRRTLLSKI